MKYIFALLFSFGVISVSFSQDQDSVYTDEEGHVVCFQTAENEVTCFVDSEALEREEGKQAPDSGSEDPSIEEEEDSIYREEEYEEDVDGSWL